MRTTVDIPESVLRRAKAEAALRGMKLKDFVTQALRAALEGGERRVAERAPEYGSAERQQMGNGCVFPLIRGADGPELRDLTPERVRAILEEEDVERARRPTDPG